MPGRFQEDYFELQLRFAMRYAVLARLPVREALERCTNLRRRFGLMDASAAGAWTGFLDSLPADAGVAELLERTMAFHERRVVPPASPFGCFSHDPPDAQGVVRLHFMPGEQHRADSPLGQARLPERRSELRALFAELRSRHPQARQVQGLSWLYNLAAYKSLFPPEYTASIALPAFAPGMNGSSTWGQVLNHRHEVKAGMAGQVLARLDAAIVQEPWRAFPLRALSAACPVDRFYDAFA